MLQKSSTYTAFNLLFLFMYFERITAIYSLSNLGNRLFLAPGIKHMQMKALWSSKCTNFYFRNTAWLCQQLALSEAEVFAPAFVSFHLNHCNALFASLLEHKINRLQLVSNVAAGILTGTRWSEHIIPLLSPSSTACQSNFTLAPRCSPWPIQPFKAFNHAFSLLW